MDISPATLTGYPLSAGSGIPAGLPAIAHSVGTQRTDSAPAPLPQQPATASTESLKSAVAQLQQQLRAVAPDLEFSIDQDTGRTLIKVVDASTQEVLRQIPSEEVLKMDKTISGYLGLLMNKHA